MANLVKQGGRADYNYKEYMFDSSIETLVSIDTSDASEGSICFDMKTGTAYMLNKNKEWIEL